MLLKAGDVVVAHQKLPHLGTSNYSPDVRYQVRLRGRVISPRTARGVFYQKSERVKTRRGIKGKRPGLYLQPRLVPTLVECCPLFPTCMPLTATTSPMTPTMPTNVSDDADGEVYFRVSHVDLFAHRDAWLDDLLLPFEGLRAAVDHA